MRSACGWGEISVAIAELALQSGIAGVSASRAGKLLGFGRVVGDGVLYFYLQDVVVAPTEQGQGVGRLIMQRLLGRIREIAPTGATIGLMSATGKEGFYERFGFTVRPATSYGAGMTQLVK